MRLLPREFRLQRSYLVKVLRSELGAISLVSVNNGNWRPTSGCRSSSESLTEMISASSIVVIPGNVELKQRADDVCV